MRDVKLGLMLAVAASALFAGAAGAARGDSPALTGDVGANDAFVISLKDAGGAPVTHLAAGTYTLTIHDHSAEHNFHLSGPGDVDVSTTPDFVGDQTFTVTLVDGQYFFQCDPHATRMKGRFGVGTFTLPAPAPAPKRASASLGAGGAFRLAPARLPAGKVVLAVADRSAKDGFRLNGPGIAKSTGTAFRGTVTWAVTLRAGTYSYGSAKSPKHRRTFVVA
jgi:plastocyanin